MPDGRERWANRRAFVMAAIGSAVGLGNVWRFPYVAFKNGGGAFFIPYFVALITAGIPIMIVEYALGQRFQQGAPGALGSISKRFRWIGWFALLIAFTIVFYYLIVMAMSWAYMAASPGMAWTRPVAIHEPAEELGKEKAIPAERIVLYHPYRNAAERERLERLQQGKPESQRFRILSEAEAERLRAAEAQQPESQRKVYVSFEDNIDRYFLREALGGLDSMATWGLQCEHNVALGLCRRILAVANPRFEAGRMRLGEWLDRCRAEAKNETLRREVEAWAAKFDAKYAGKPGHSFLGLMESLMPQVAAGKAERQRYLADMFRPTGRLLFWSFVTWVSIYFIVAYGVKTVGRVVMWTVPLPVILLLIMLGHSIFLDGAADGIRYYLTPDWSMLRDASVWIAAYGQVFFSLSLGFGILIAYASYLPRGHDVTNNAFLTSFADAATSFLAGFVVFSVLGYLAYIKGGVPVADVAKGGPGLVFVMYPIALAKFPGLWGNVVGVLFFLCLLFLGIDSAFSLVEAVLTGVSDARPALNRKRVTLALCAVGFVAGTPFAAKSGLMWLDIVDNWMNNYGLVIVGLLECIAVGYFFRLEDLTEYINERSEIHLHRWFDFFVRVVTPGVLIFLLAQQVSKDLAATYGGYDTVLPNAVSLAGWGYFGLLLFLSFLIARNWDLAVWYLSTAVVFVLFRLALGRSGAALTGALATVCLCGGFIACLRLAMRGGRPLPPEEARHGASAADP